MMLKISELGITPPTMPWAIQQVLTLDSMVSLAKNIESWASLSILQTKADIIGDSYQVDGNTIEPGYYNRPTNQLVNFNLFFSRLSA